MLRSTSSFLLLAALAIGLAAGGCSDSEGPTLEESVRVFLTGDLDAARPMLARAAGREPDNADARAWHAECLRRLGDFDKAYAEAAAALAVDPGHSFAHTVLGDLFSPRLGSWEKADADSAWVHFLLAVESDPNDGNAWSSLYIHSMRHNDWGIEHMARAGMVQSGFLTPSVLAYNRWQLVNLPPNAILLTNGDMDTYPAVALQETEGLREDVAVINRSLLNLPWYIRNRALVYSLDLPFSDDEIENLKPYRNIDGDLVTESDQIIAGWIEMQRLRELDRPLCAAVTLSRFDFTEDALDRLVYCGSYFEYVPRPPGYDADIGRVGRSLESLEAGDFEGPFASDIDRSPVRRTHTDNLAQNITAAMLRYARLLAEHGRLDEAREALERAERFDSRIRAGGAFEADFDSLREDLGAII
jgi:tetratricopeptide (TPR) repeat protein